MPNGISNAWHVILVGDKNKKALSFKLSNGPKADTQNLKESCVRKNRQLSRTFHNCRIGTKQSAHKFDENEN